MPNSQSHHLPVSVAASFGLGSLAHWSVLPARHLVVFVHGFGGSARNTWPDFPSLLTANPLLEAFDFLFYGYNGRTQQAHNSANEFGAFLSNFLGDPAAFVNQSIPTGYKRSNFGYDRIVLVAHSLGAVVVRRALLDFYERVQLEQVAGEWLDGVRLVLMAPAHNGAFAAQGAYAALGDLGWPVLKLIGHYVRYRIPLLTELQVNSLVITTLHRDTAAVIDAHRSAGKAIPAFLRAHSVLWAKDELVVQNAKFFVDPQAVLVAADHHGVCKPKDVTHQALQHVWSAL